MPSPDHQEPQKSNHESLGDYDGPTFLAQSLARRGLSESARIRRRMRELSHSPSQPPHEAEAINPFIKMITARTVDIFLPKPDDDASTQLPQPDYFAFNRSRLALIDSPDAIRNTVLSLYPDTNDQLQIASYLQGEQLIRFHNLLRRKFQAAGTLRPVFGDITDLIKMYTQAKEMAREGAHEPFADRFEEEAAIADVYGNDQRYNELTKNYFGSARQFAEHGLLRIDEVTAEKYEEFTRVAEDIVAQDTNPDDFETAAKEARVLRGLILGERVEELWGFIAFLSLPDEIRRKLTPDLEDN